MTTSAHASLPIFRILKLSTSILPASRFIQSEFYAILKKNSKGSESRLVNTKQRNANFLNILVLHEATGLLLRDILI